MGLWLVWVGVVRCSLALGALAIVAALAYTGGPFPYGYRALGEVFVFIFFGLVAVAGTAYLQALRFDRAVRRGGDPAGCADHRDPRGQQPARHPHGHGGRQADAGGGAGRARRPRSSTRCCSRSAYVVPVVLAGLWTRGGAGPNAGTSAGLVPLALLPLLTLPMASPLLRAVRTFREPRELNPVLKGTARLSLVVLAAVRAGPGAGRASFGGPAG